LYLEGKAVIILKTSITGFCNNWLPIHYRIIFKIGTLMHSILRQNFVSVILHDLVQFATADSTRSQRQFSTFTMVSRSKRIGSLR